MKDRINDIITNYKLTPTEFADKIGVGKSNISHILSGRNNPSLEMVKRILSEFPNINSDWLIFGVGQMLKVKPSGPTQQNMMLDFVEKEDNVIHDTDEGTKTNNVDTNVKEFLKVDVEEDRNVSENNKQSKISKIIIYYTDNTYESFDPSNKPL